MCTPLRSHYFLHSYQILGYVNNSIAQSASNAICRTCKSSRGSRGGNKNCCRDATEWTDKLNHRSNGGYVLALYNNPYSNFSPRAKGFGKFRYQSKVNFSTRAVYIVPLARRQRRSPSPWISSRRDLWRIKALSRTWDNESSRKSFKLLFVRGRS